MTASTATEGGIVASAIVESQAGYAQTVRTGHHRLQADEPIAAGGTDTGPSPYSLLLSALGACTAITLRMYAGRKGWELGTTHVSLRVLHEGTGHSIERDIRFSAPLSAEQRERLAEIADKTPVTRTLRDGVAIVTRVVDGV
jgi:putative redox protein